MTKSIAFFDFDGTITTRDTMLELIRFKKGSYQYYKGMAFLSPLLAGVKAGLVDAQQGKERLMGHFWGGTEIADFHALCEEFCENKLPRILRPGALQKISEYKDQGMEVVVVSASAAQWVEPWTKKMKLSLISSKLKEDGLRISGKLEGLNCNGDQKVIRIREAYNLENYNSIYCFGDTKGDLPMLALATHPFFKPFR